MVKSDSASSNPGSKSAAKGRGKEKEKEKERKDKGIGKVKSSSSSSADRLKQPKLSFGLSQSQSGSTSTGRNQSGRSLGGGGSQSNPGASQRSLSSLASIFALSSQSTNGRSTNNVSSTNPSTSAQSQSQRSPSAAAITTATSSFQPLTSSQEIMPPPKSIPNQIIAKSVSKHHIDSPSDDKGMVAFDHVRDPSNQVWSEKYPPQARSDLAIHPKKIKDVESWLRESLDGSLAMRKCRRMLVLTGPCGSGKTSVVKVLSSKQELDFSILEWNQEPSVGTNPNFYTRNSNRSRDLSLGSENGNGRDWKEKPEFSPSSSLGWNKDDQLLGDSSDSIISKFNEFIQSSSKFNPLRLNSTSSSSMEEAEEGKNNSRRVILLEDLPNLSHASTNVQFQTILTNFLENSNQISDSSELSPPMILIISTSLPKFDEESFLTEGASGGGGNENSSVDWRERLKNSRNFSSTLDLGIRNHRGTTQISFNPIAETYLKKGLKRILALEFHHRDQENQRRNQVVGKGRNGGFNQKISIPPPMELIDLLARDSQGDVRNAINSLQFLSGMRLDSSSPSSSSSNGSQGRKRGRDGGMKLDSRANAKSKGKGKGQGKKSGGNEDIKRQYSQLIKMIARRESSLALFHLIGKILWNKRFGDTGESDEEEDEDGEEEEEEEDSSSEVHDSEMDDEEEVIYERRSKGKEKTKSVSRKSSNKIKSNASDSSETDEEEGEGESSMKLDSISDRNDFDWSDQEEEEEARSRSRKSKSKMMTQNQNQHQHQHARESTSRIKIDPKNKARISPSRHLTSEERLKIKKAKERREDRRDLKRWKSSGFSEERKGQMDFPSKDLPNHLKDFQRRKSRVDVNKLYLSSPVDHSMLQLYLHQNYPSFLTDVDQASEIMEGLSFSDSEIGSKNGQDYQHLNLISQYNFSISVHQTLLSLPSPVPRTGKRQQFYKSSFFDAHKRGQERISKLDQVGKKLQAGGQLDELVYAQAREPKPSSGLNSANSGPASASASRIGSGNRFGASNSSFTSGASSGSTGKLSNGNPNPSQSQLNGIGKQPLKSMSQKEIDRLELIGLSLGNRLSREDLSIDLLPALSKINLARKSRGEEPVIQLPPWLSNLGLMPKESTNSLNAKTLGENEVEVEVRAEEQEEEEEEDRRDENREEQKKNQEEVRAGSGWEEDGMRLDRDGDQGGEGEEEEEEEEELLFLPEDDVEEFED